MLLGEDQLDVHSFGSFGYSQDVVLQIKSPRSISGIENMNKFDEKILI